MREHGPWTIHSTQKMYADAWVEVFRDLVTRPDGKPGTYATVVLKSGVCVLARDGRGVLHLTREFHYAVGRVTIEGVSGGIDADESALEAAQRELEEELGLRAMRWTHLGRIDPFTAAIHSTVDLYLAEELSSCEKSPEGTELIEPVCFPFAQTVAMVLSGEITHAPTCIAILRLALGDPGR